MTAVYRDTSSVVEELFPLYSYNSNSDVYVDISWTETEKSTWYAFKFVFTW